MPYLSRADAYTYVLDIFIFLKALYHATKDPAAFEEQAIDGIVYVIRGKGFLGVCYGHCKGHQVGLFNSVMGLEESKVILERFEMGMTVYLYPGHEVLDVLPLQFHFNVPDVHTNSAFQFILLPSHDAFLSLAFKSITFLDYYVFGLAIG